MTGHPMVALGDFLSLKRDEVVLKPTERYRVAGIYSWGRGLFERAPVLGAETSYKALYRLTEGLFVVSRLNGWEGALDVVDASFENAMVSNEFPTFAVDRAQVEGAYLKHLCRWPALWDALVPRGSMVRRKRVNVDQLLSVKVPVPSLEVQRRIASRLTAIKDAASTITDRFTSTDNRRLVTLLPKLADTVISRSATVHARVADLADFVSDTVHPGEDPAPAAEFVGLQHVEGHTGRWLGSDPIMSMKGRKFRFRPGDVVYGYLRPYQNKVWVADRHGLCSVDQYVLRPRPRVNSELLAYALRGQRTLSTAIDLTHSLQLPRLRSGLLGSIEISTVAESDQSALVGRLDMIRDRVIRAATVRQHQRDLASALVPAALNEAFAGLS